jgi:hypothetical protein
MKKVTTQWLTCASHTVGPEKGPLVISPLTSVRLQIPHCWSLKLPPLELTPMDSILYCPEDYGDTSETSEHNKNATNWSSAAVKKLKTKKGCFRLLWPITPLSGGKPCHNPHTLQEKSKMSLLLHRSYAFRIGSNFSMMYLSLDSHPGAWWEKTKIGFCVPAATFDIC